MLANAMEFVEMIGRRTHTRTAARRADAFRGSGPARGTRAAHERAKEREGTTVKARTASHTEGCLGTSWGISGFVEYNIVPHPERRHSRREERAPGVDDNMREDVHVAEEAPRGDQE